MVTDKPELDEHDIEKGPVYVDVPMANTAITTTSIVTVTESPATPSSSTPSSSTPTNCAPSDKAKLQVPSPISLVGGRAAEPLKVKGWGRFKYKEHSSNDRVWDGDKNCSKFAKDPQDDHQNAGHLEDQSAANLA